MSIKPKNYLAILFEMSSFRVAKISERIDNMSPIYLVEGRPFNRLPYVSDWSWLDYYEKDGRAVGLRITIMEDDGVPKYFESINRVEIFADTYGFNVWFVDQHDARLVPCQTETHEYYGDESGRLMALFDTRGYQEKLELGDVPTFEIQRPSLSIENVSSW